MLPPLKPVEVTACRQFLLAALPYEERGESVADALCFTAVNPPHDSHIALRVLESRAWRQWMDGKSVARMLELLAVVESARAA